MVAEQKTDANVSCRIQLPDDGLCVLTVPPLQIKANRSALNPSYQFRTINIRLHQIRLPLSPALAKFKQPFSAPTMSTVAAMLVLFKSSRLPGQMKIHCSMGWAANASKVRITFRPDYARHAVFGRGRPLNGSLSQHE